MKRRTHSQALVLRNKTPPTLPNLCKVPLSYEAYLWRLILKNIFHISALDSPYGGRSKVESYPIRRVILYHEIAPLQASTYIAASRLNTSKFTSHRAGDDGQLSG